MIEIPIGADGIPVMSRSGHEAGHCPSREHRIYDLGIQDESDYSRRGTAYHSCMKFYIKRLVKAGLKADFEEASLAFVEGIAESKCPPHLLSEVREIFDRDVQHFELPIDNIIGVETRDVRLDAPVPYQFRPDITVGWPQQDVLEVVDHKTYWVSFTAVQARELYQSRYNAWCAMQEFKGFSVYRMTYRFPRLNTLVSCEFSPAEFDELDREIRANEAVRRARYKELAEAHAAFKQEAETEWCITLGLAELQQREREIWPEIPGDQCAFCTLKCSIVDDGKRVLTRITNGDEFESAAGLVLATERRISAVKKALRAKSTVEGPRVVNGETFGFFPTKSVSYDGGRVVDKIREMGEEPSFRISASKLKAEIKRLPGLAAELGDCLPSEKSSARYSHRSLKSTSKTANPAEEEGDEE